MMPVLDTQSSGPFQSRAAMPILEVSGVSKTFIMHLRGGARLPVMSDLSLSLYPSECLALMGPSGAGKSTLLRMIYGNYRCETGTIRIHNGSDWVGIENGDPRTIRSLRYRTVGYVSQFLRVIPRVSTFAIVASAGREAGLGAVDADTQAGTLLRRLNIQQPLWDLPPATFSGGEQQRVNIARGLIGGHKILLLDEPTASLDPGNRDVVIELIIAAKARGTAILGIFHDADVRARVADRGVDVARLAA